MPSHAGICYSGSHRGIIIPLIMTTIMDCRLKGQSFKMMCLIGGYDRDGWTGVIFCVESEKIQTFSLWMAWKGCW